MIVVSDASPIINLECVNLLELLPAIFGEVIIPQAVYHELSVGGFKFEGAPWLRARSARNVDLVRSLEEDIDAGEAEAIVLAKELGADLVLIDERLGRRVAREHGLNITGLLGVLRTAKGRGLVTAVKPILDDLMRSANFWVDSRLYQEYLESIDEP